MLLSFSHFACRVSIYKQYMGRQNSAKSKIDLVGFVWLERHSKHFSEKNDWFADNMIALPKVTEYSFTKIISKEIHYFTDI